MQPLDESHDAAAAAPSVAPEWVQDYNSTLARRTYARPLPPGPSCYAGAPFSSRARAREAGREAGGRSARRARRA